MNYKRLHLFFLLLLLGYWAVSLYALTIVPRVYEDEPWQASVGAKLAAQGILGSDLFEGYHEMERHYFGFMPLYPLMLAGLFRFADAGLLQARFVGVGCGLLVLTLTYSLAKRSGPGARVGLLAAGLLLSVRAFALSPLHPTGILFFDAVRVARYDVAVPVFGLAALHAYLSARRAQTWFWYGLAGLLCALATLTHLYGGFFLLTILVVMATEKSSRRPAAFGAVLGGFILPCALYALYAFGHFDAWRAQTRMYGERFELLNPEWYARNLRRERLRYAFGWSQGAWWLRPGLWLAIVGGGASFVWLARRAFRLYHFAARLLFIVLIVFLGGYALLLYTKFTNYLFAVLPFLALALAWSLINIFSAASTRRPRLAAIGACLLGGALLTESIFQMAQLRRDALTLTPYKNFIVQVQAFIPRRARVSGMHHYGLGWNEYEYRSLAAPLLLSDAALEVNPLSLADALDAQQPAYLLIDERMRGYLKNDARPQRQVFWAWMNAHNAALVGTVRDATYGTIDIYRMTQ